MCYTSKSKKNNKRHLTFFFEIVTKSFSQSFHAFYESSPFRTDTL